MAAFGAELGEVLEGLRGVVDMLEGAKVEDGVVQGKFFGQGLIHISDVCGALVGGVVE